jgi:hypothetical protein
MLSWAYRVWSREAMGIYLGEDTALGYRCVIVSEGKGCRVYIRVYGIYHAR